MATKMIKIKDFNPTKKPGQSAREYYLNKRTIWWLRKEVESYNKDYKNEANWNPVMEFNSSKNGDSKVNIYK